MNTKDVAYLPSLREDIKLLKGAKEASGEPTWLLFDPLRNKYFRLDSRAFQLLSRWQTGTVDDLIKISNQETACCVNQQDVEALIKFLYMNNLTRDAHKTGYMGYLQQSIAFKKNPLIWLIHNYLFIRIPLVRPMLFLKSTYPLVTPFFNLYLIKLTLVLGIFGIFLTLRQWDVFLSNFLYFFSAKGLIGYILAIIFVKICHELGHAYTATRYGVRVPTMGIAFLVLFPVLYTDTTDAWHLTDRKKRIRIAAAGMLVEFGIALLSTLAWNFLPDGILRNIAFFTATTSWITTLLTNANPFMRFDGYYLLSDWLGVDNLQDRSFDLARWKLRELLFRLKIPPPWPTLHEIHHWLIIYAWGIWVYRFFLFLGIAILVYHFFFKILGILLFLVEIIYFILLPICRELINWYKLRKNIMISYRSYMVFCLLGLFIAVLFIPWNGALIVPAVMEAKTTTTIYSVLPGRITQVLTEVGQTVQSGDILLTLESPEIESDLRRSKEKIDVLQHKLDWFTANIDDRNSHQIYLGQFASELSHIEGLRERQKQLLIRAPFSGMITDADNALKPGRWISVDSPLFYLVAVEGPHTILAYASETAVHRLQDNTKGVFYPEDALRKPVAVTLVEANDAGENLPILPYFWSIYEGDIPTRSNQDGEITADYTVFRLVFEPEEGYQSPRQTLRGRVRLAAEKEGFFTRFYRTASSVLIRESGF